MVLQETFGEFDSPERLRSLIQLICQLPGTYEVLIKSETGEEGILHCANDTVKNAACRNLSGMEAFAAILAWGKGKYWLEELPVLPMRTLNLPLKELFVEADKVLPPAETTTASEAAAETTPPGETNPPRPAEKSGIQKPEIRSESTRPQTVQPESDQEHETPAEPEEIGSRPEPLVDAAEQVKKEPAKAESEPAASEPQPSPPQIAESGDSAESTDSNESVESALAKNIAAVQGVMGVIISSQDGILLARANIDPAEEQVQMIALFSEALDQIGELFGKGKLIHGAIDMASERILVHTFRRSFVGSFIAPNVSAAMVGEKIEQLISGEEK